MNPFRHVCINEGFMPYGDTSSTYLVLNLLGDRFDDEPWDVDDNPYAALFDSLGDYRELDCVRELRARLNAKVPTYVD